ncbi:MAG: HAD family hydrolase [Gammaproteobacteria bacterium]
MKNFAFFDVDGTLLNIKTMFSFQEYYYLKFSKYRSIRSKINYLMFLLRMQYYLLVGKSREYINKKFYESFAGINKEDVKNCAYQWYADLKRENSKLFILQALAVLKKHQDIGDEVVFVSGSSLEILAPIAEDLGVKHVLATNLEIKHNKFTGNIMPPQTIGCGKQIAILEFLKAYEGSIGYTYGYADDDSDIPMLSATDFPTVIPGNAMLERHAERKEWEKLVLIS